MNAKTYTIKLKLQHREVYEAVNGLLHTLIFYRSSAAGECRTTVHTDATGTTTFDYVNCENIWFPHVQVRSPRLEAVIREKAQLFSTELKSSDMQRGTICLEFCEKSTDMFIPTNETWEIWRIEVCLKKLFSLRDQWEHRHDVYWDLLEAVSMMSTAVNSSPHPPLASTPDDIPRIFDTTFTGIQPYHFKVTHKIDFQGRRSSVLSDLRKWIGKNAFLY